MINGLLLDGRAALRSLRRAPTFSFTVILCIALGIGANTAVFSVVKSVLIQELPFPEPGRLVNLWVGYANDGFTGRFSLSPQQIMEIRDRNTVLTTVAGFRAEEFSLTRDEFPVEVSGARVTGSLFDVVGATPLTGRVFNAEEDRNGLPVAVISEGLWDRVYGRQPNVVGQPIRLNGAQYEVVGVLPNQARVPAEVDAWLPLSLERTSARMLTAGNISVVGQLGPGVTAEAARVQLAQVAADIARDLPDRNTNLTIDILGWQAFLVETTRTALLTLMVAVAGVLALAMSNVASLLTVRAQREQRHQALRAALGASSRRIVRYLLVENGLLVLIGSVLGVVAARLSLPALLALQPETLSPFRSIAVDFTVLGFSATLAVMVALTVTGFTVWRLRYGSLTRRLAEGGSGAGVSRNAQRVQQSLVITQVAASLVLLIGSSVMIRNFIDIQQMDPGFEADPVLAVRLASPPARATEHERRVGYFQEVLEAVRAVPGVASAGAAMTLPVSGGNWGMGFNVEGQPPATANARHVAVWRLATPGYYDVMGIPILRGRAFDLTDGPNSTPVAIVSETLASTYWPGENPVGKRVKRGTYQDPTEPWRTVVGVIPDIRDSALAGRARSALHFPHAQYSTPVGAIMSVVARMEGRVQPADQVNVVETAIRRVDGAALIHENLPFRTLLIETIAQERFNALLLSIFAIVGLGLAAVGIYGMVSYSAEQRRTEFGLRIAFGARGRDVRRLMLNTGSMMAVVGVTVGIGIAYALSPLVQSMLSTGSARDPLVYVVAGATLFVTTVIAAWLPAHRATKVDPITVLRR